MDNLTATLSDTDNSLIRSGVGEGLSRRQKAIPCRWLYDERGSLFEDITRLEDYYPTRAEPSILRTRQLVLPVGGIKEKVVAAAAAGLTRVLPPARNRRDFDDIPAGARDKLEFVWLERVDDAIAAALEEIANPAASATDVATQSQQVPLAARRAQ
ncbi:MULTISPECIES: L-histidine N(alpha)-methyltransferase [unclassified Mesorhizobium]|uniref:L-histidine N(alpha)-methyltransferase n=1 Tax=Mesorhizobium sp. BR1-1-6 TaxID=2876648 RepID=UPI0015E30293